MHHWYWFIAAAALLILEMFSGTFYLLVVSIALAGAGVAAWLGAGGGAALLVAVVLSAAGIAAVYRWRRNHRTAATEDVDLDIGNTVLLHQPQSGKLWLVQYRGTYWQAEADFAAQAGQTARIAGKSGNILILQPLEEN
ncbi:NfeD family protein [Eikenella sp. S3360]|uniref:NfeD family protein n=1 Tax=Eikenella glucosivorans TaxID=2766967 RepID=A0ABS0NBB4_9NEIS|nr:NfeD family protein [Eikenella glucosivorans]MBH5329560.1 NfeD family protein [Eikenella glucosivorans]